jgi:hypothetical protein
LPAKALSFYYLGNGCSWPVSAGLERLEGVPRGLFIPQKRPLELGNKKWPADGLVLSA